MEDSSEVHDLTCLVIVGERKILSHQCLCWNQGGSVTLSLWSHVIAGRHAAKQTMT